MLYSNFRKRYWEPVFERLGLVALLAGYANPNVTLGHYTQAVRGGEIAMAALERAYDLER